MRTTLSLIILGAILAVPLTGCSKPKAPSVTGSNMFHDITQVRRGMGPSEVRRVMGSKYTTRYEEGIRGVDGGNYVWDYPEGSVYMGLDGVTRVEPAGK